MGKGFFYEDILLGVGLWGKNGFCIGGVKLLL